MVNENDIIESVKSIELDNDSIEATTIEDNRTDSRSVVLFFGFDIVNSTQVKTMAYDSWTEILDGILKNVQETVNTKFREEVQLWRIQGDCIVFVCSVNKFDLNEKVRDVSRVLKKVNKWITDKTNSLNNLNYVYSFLGLQAFAWIGIVTNDLNDVRKHPFDNYSKKIKIRDTEVMFEFLGNDIDTGFRIAKYTRNGQLALSFELAYFLLENNNSILDLVTYKKLKGVWNNKYYPIIWYDNTDTKEGITQNFAFDAGESDELIKEYYQNKDHEDQSPLRQVIQVKDLDMFTLSKEMMDRIIKDRRLSSKINEMRKLLINPGSVDELIKPSLIEMHCVAICYFKEGDDYKFLIAKRKNKDYMDGKWEFGCAKPRLQDTIEESLTDEYKKDFGVSIVPVCDSCRSDKSPIPFAVYKVIKQENSIQKGIIFAAEITNVEEMKRNIAAKNFEKHSEVLLESYESIINRKNSSEQFVPDFFDSLRKVYSYLKKEEKVSDVY